MAIHSSKLVPFLKFLLKRKLQHDAVCTKMYFAIATFMAAAKYNLLWNLGFNGFINSFTFYLI